MRSSHFALLVVGWLGGCGGSSGEETIEVTGGKADATPISLAFDGSHAVSVNLNVHENKNIDVTVSGGTSQQIGLLLFEESRQLTGIIGTGVARIKSYPVHPGSYRLTIKDLSRAGGNVSFTAGTASSQVVRIEVPGYLVGAVGATDEDAQKSWAQACTAWQKTITNLYVGADSAHPFAQPHLDRVELLDCGQPTLIAGVKQVESTSMASIVADVIPGKLERAVKADGFSPSGDTLASEPAARAAWMNSCLTEIDRQTALDRDSDVFLAVGCGKPQSFPQQDAAGNSIGVSFSGPLTLWRAE